MFVHQRTEEELGWDEEQEEEEEEEEEVWFVEEVWEEEGDVWKEEEWHAQQQAPQCLFSPLTARLPC